MKTVSGYNRFLREELSKIPGVSIRHPEDAVPHILNVSVKGIRGTRMQQALNEKGICVSSQVCLRRRVRRHARQRRRMRSAEIEIGR